MKPLEIIVIGSENYCATCIGAPSSRETASWLQSALSRRYDPSQFFVRYIDMDSVSGEEGISFLKDIEGDPFYPVIVIGGRVVSEGPPSLKGLYQELEQVGLKAKQKTSLAGG
ncbi:MAG: DUF1462 family protein [Thermicanus sp.]|nr:DUF1462 family protein [Thermicanus sp.]